MLLCKLLCLVNRSFFLFFSFFLIQIDALLSNLISNNDNNNIRETILIASTRGDDHTLLTHFLLRMHLVIVSFVILLSNISN